MGTPHHYFLGLALWTDDGAVEVNYGIWSCHDISV